MGKKQERCKANKESIFSRDRLIKPGLMLFKKSFSISVVLFLFEGINLVREWLLLIPKKGVSFKESIENIFNAIKFFRY